MKTEREKDAEIIRKEIAFSYSTVQKWIQFTC